MLNVTSSNRLTPTAKGAKSAEHAFSSSLFVSGIRCGLTYVIMPFVFPILGFGSGVAPIIGVPVGIIAIIANVVSIRRFRRANHRWKRPIIAINAAIIGLLLVLIAVDITELL